MPEALWSASRFPRNGCSDDSWQIGLGLSNARMLTSGARGKRSIVRLVIHRRSFPQTALQAAEARTGNSHLPHVDSSTPAWLVAVR
jgi:hypothetical protein